MTMLLGFILLDFIRNLFFQVDLFTSRIILCKGFLNSLFLIFVTFNRVLFTLYDKLLFKFSYFLIILFFTLIFLNFLNIDLIYLHLFHIYNILALHFGFFFYW
jgi:hypothetical protein